jgi:two-component system alkaline phosphatase synthesis response regulator PhoP
MKPKILIVEDEESLVTTIRDRLQSEGYCVEAAADGITGLHRAGHEHFEAIILDIMLPGISGFDLCRDLRQQGIATPILMLTARGQLIDKVLGLKLGADDYLTKPFEMMELLARIEALLRRLPKNAGGNLGYSFGDVEVNFRQAEVRVGGSPVELSAKEYQMLKYFIEHREAVISRHELLDQVWGYDAVPSTRTVDVHISWLRQKLEPNPAHPQYFLTVHGLGYKFIG